MWNSGWAKQDFHIQTCSQRPLGEYLCLCDRSCCSHTTLLWRFIPWARIRKKLHDPNKWDKINYTLFEQQQPIMIYQDNHVTTFFAPKIATAWAAVLKASRAHTVIRCRLHWNVFRYICWWKLAVVFSCHTASPNSKDSEEKSMKLPIIYQFLKKEGTKI